MPLEAILEMVADWTAIAQEVDADAAANPWIYYQCTASKWFPLARTRARVEWALAVWDLGGGQ